MQLNIGGSADCPGLTGPGGNVERIQLPEGRYNVNATFFFTLSGTVGFDAGD